MTSSEKSMKKTSSRFLIVGASNFVWGLFSFPIMYFLSTPLGIDYLYVLVFTYLLNTLISFFTQKIFVFKTKGNHARELSKFALVQGSILVLNLFLLPQIIKFSHLSPVISQTVFVLLVAGLSFVIHHFFTFRLRKTND
jgi:putative flippase GtrA